MSNGSKFSFLATILFILLAASQASTLLSRYVLSSPFKLSSLPNMAELVVADIAVAAEVAPMVPMGHRQASRDGY